MKYTNELIHETSPYLLQHAHNPVNWLPYNKLAFTIAQRENKPVLVSIGYSSCHWCHVMEHESFEDEIIAALMNEYFVCVKVDREERPDVDHVFMDAVQQIHGNGGWPLNCFALPDGRPFWGGTYFKPEQWKQLLVNINELFHNRNSELKIQAAELADGVARQNYLLGAESRETTGFIDFAAVNKLLQTAFDHEKGGLSGAPKFPMPLVLMFMQINGIRLNDEESMQLVEITLNKMACGGIYDQAGGGFARYSTDSDWKVPHFEKMLYDNAQLINVYASAYQASPKAIYKDIIEQTLDFTFRELTSPEGVFYSAIDADSEGEEGLFYTWTQEQFNDALGHYSKLLGEYFGVGTYGLWEKDRNILLRPYSNELFSQQHFLSAEELSSLVTFSRNQLLKSRMQRPRPALDDKMLVAWNSLMINALIGASVALGNDAYMHAAVKTGEFILENLKRPGKGLYHTWKNGKAQIDAFLDDYAFFCDALLNLYSITTEPRWLYEAEIMANYVTEHFYDSHSGFFWYSEDNDDQVFARKIEIYDGVIPSGNSVMAKVMNTLGIFLYIPGFTEKVLQMLSIMESRVERYPAAYANWASLALTVAGKQNVIAVIGEKAIQVIKELKSKLLFNPLIFGSRTESALPYFKGRFAEGRTLIYICSGNYCSAPVETAEDAIRLIGSEPESRA